MGTPIYNYISQLFDTTKYTDPKMSRVTIKSDGQNELSIEAKNIDELYHDIVLADDVQPKVTDYINIIEKQLTKRLTFPYFISRYEFLLKEKSIKASVTYNLPRSYTKTLTRICNQTTTISDPSFYELIWRVDMLGESRNGEFLATVETYETDGEYQEFTLSPQSVPLQTIPRIIASLQYDQDPKPLFRNVVFYSLRFGGRGKEQARLKCSSEYTHSIKPLTDAYEEAQEKITISSK